MFKELGNNAVFWVAFNLLTGFWFDSTFNLVVGVCLLPFALSDVAKGE